MTKTIKVPKKKAQEMQQYLLEKNLLNKKFRLTKDNSFIYFPIKKEFKTAYKIAEKDLEKKQEKPKTFKEILSEKLSRQELEQAKTAYDTVGEIAILEIDDVLKNKKELIGKSLLETNKKIKTVLRKAGEHKGEFRTQKMEYLAGVNTKETIVKENGVRLKVNVEKVYYSIRLSTERKRILEKIQEGEKVLCMFSGVGPYPIVFAKNTKAKKIIAIEINPLGDKLCKENILLNKIINVTSYCGDVKNIIPQKIQPEKFDRITMPLPKTAEEFLPIALTCATKGTIIHYYAFLHDSEFHLAHEQIQKACEQAQLSYKILETVKCGQHAPRIWRICVDIQIL